MGLIKKLTRSSGATDLPADQKQRQVQGGTGLTTHTAARRTSSRAVAKSKLPQRGPTASGIPPLKEPKLPLGRSAILILCTQDRRPYWHVFKKAPSTTLGWEWERHLPAVPVKPGKSTPTAASANAQIAPEGEGLDIGGRYWEGWYCPGCNQSQQQVNNGFLHFYYCYCGARLCAGPGNNQDRNPICPNCATERRVTSSLGRHPISGVHGAEHSGAGGKTLPGPDRKQIG